MWRIRKEEQRAAAAAPASSIPPAPKTDTSVFLPEDGENQTPAREEFVKNLGLEKL